MSNVTITTVPSVMPIGSGVSIAPTAFGRTGGYVCADLVFGRVRATATAMKQHPGTQVWSPPS